VLDVGCSFFLFRTPKGSKTIAQGNALGFRGSHNTPQAEGLQEGFEFLQPFRLQVVFGFPGPGALPLAMFLRPFRAPERIG